MTTQKKYKTFGAYSYISLSQQKESLDYYWFASVLTFGFLQIDQDDVCLLIFNLN